MARHSENLYGACNFCIHAKQIRLGYWYCTSHQDVFPNAPFDKDDDTKSTSCPSYKRDSTCP